MNIDDIAEVEIPERSIFSHIFQHQHKLAIEYAPIERKNGFFYPEPDDPPHIDDAHMQEWVKRMFWRTTEEFGEAYEDEPNLDKWRDKWDNDAGVRHFFEEVIDALHFFVEVCSISGIAPIDFEDIWHSAVPEDNSTDGSPPPELGYSEQRDICLQTIIALGITANVLKNKPWKQAQMPTDVTKFRSLLLETWRWFAHFLGSFGMTKREVYVLYCKKAQVNEFRQRSNY